MQSVFDLAMGERIDFVLDGVCAGVDFMSESKSTM
jgi:hypothetical protein